MCTARSGVAVLRVITQGGNILTEQDTPFAKKKKKHVSRNADFRHRAQKGISGLQYEESKHEALHKRDAQRKYSPKKELMIRKIKGDTW